jgi:putative flippase GtrA
MSVPRSAAGGRAQVARFVVVGVVNTVVSYAAFRLALRLLHGPAAPALAQACAYAVGIACSFVLNRQWTFRSGGARGPEFARFVASQVAMLVLSSAAIGLAVGAFGAPATPAWVVTTGAVAVVNYLALHHWVFRRAVPAA